MVPVPILILAAGASSRMKGRDKLLEPVNGIPLLRERVRTALATGHPVLVTLPPRDRAPVRWDVIEDLPVAAIAVENASEGMATSLAAGVDALPQGAPGVMVVLADMPEITVEDMRAVILPFDGEVILRATTADGRAGHPVVFPARDFAALRSLSGDSGAKTHLSQNQSRVRAVPLPFSHARTDLDTPEAWDEWRAKAGTASRSASVD